MQWAFLSFYRSYQLEQAKAWAIRMRNEKIEDRHVNECRKVCLMLIQEMCNRWRRDQTITERSIVSVFGRDRIVNILLAGLPLDWAQCRYKMMYAVGGVYGMHWVAEQHVQAQPDLWNERFRAVGGRPTMNKRYKWLSEIPELGLAQAHPVLEECLKPRVAPWLEEQNTPQTADNDETMVDPGQVDQPKLMKQINECNTVEGFRDIYDGRDLQDALRYLRQAVGAGDLVCREHSSVCFCTHTFFVSSNGPNIGASVCVTNRPPMTMASSTQSGEYSSPISID